MGQAYIPTLQVQTTDLGPSPQRNPSSLILKVDGVIYGDSYIFETTNYTRRIFPVYDSVSNHILLKSIDYAHGTDMPVTVLNNIEVLVIG